jgi:CO/xanthine dehydrogenase FAD-binding subunit
VVRPHPCNNLPAVFLALDAMAVCTDGRREKTMPFAEMLKPEVMRGFGTKYLLTEILVPARTKSWSAASDRLAATKTDWEAWANCVVAIEMQSDLCRRAAVIIGAVLPRATRMATAEALLLGNFCDEKMARSAGVAVSSELQRLTGGSAGKAYACEVAGVLARRVLIEAFQN